MDEYFESCIRFASDTVILVNDTKALQTIIDKNGRQHERIWDEDN